MAFSLKHTLEGELEMLLKPLFWFWRPSNSRVVKLPAPSALIWTVQRTDDSFSYFHSPDGYYTTRASSTVHVLGLHSIASKVYLTVW